MLKERLNSVIKAQLFLAILTGGLFLGTGKKEIAVSLFFTSFILILSSLLLGGGILNAYEENDPVKGIRGLYVRAIFRFLIVAIFLGAGFYFLKLNIAGVMLSFFIFYSLPLFFLGREALRLKKKEGAHVRDS